LDRHLHLMIMFPKTYVQDVWKSMYIPGFRQFILKLFLDRHGGFINNDQKGWLDRKCIILKMNWCWINESMISEKVQFLFSGLTYSHTHPSMGGVASHKF
jgi:hypothetical protein